LATIALRTQGVATSSAKGAGGGMVACLTSSRRSAIAATTEGGMPASPKPTCPVVTAEEEEEQQASGLPQWCSSGAASEATSTSSRTLWSYAGAALDMSGDHVLRVGRRGNAPPRFSLRQMHPLFLCLPLKMTFVARRGSQFFYRSLLLHLCLNSGIL
jgi:hypothetical protein